MESVAFHRIFCDVLQNKTVLDILSICAPSYNDLSEEFRQAVNLPNMADATGPVGQALASRWIEFFNPACDADEATTKG